MRFSFMFSLDDSDDHDDHDDYDDHDDHDEVPSEGELKFSAILLCRRSRSVCHSFFPAFLLVFSLLTKSNKMSGIKCGFAPIFFKVVNFVNQGKVEIILKSDDDRIGIDSAFKK